jgi:hypothetical protein
MITLSISLKAWLPPGQAAHGFHIPGLVQLRLQLFALLVRLLLDGDAPLALIKTIAKLNHTDRSRWHPTASRYKKFQ